MLIFNLGLFGISMYYCFLFNIIWAEWVVQLILLWIFTISLDFLLFEFGLEVFITILSWLKNYSAGEKILKFLLAIKNLRNHY